MDYFAIELSAWICGFIFIIVSICMVAYCLKIYCLDNGRGRFSHADERIRTDVETRV